VNLELTEEQQMVRRTARDYATRVLAPRAAARDIDGTFPEEELRALAGLGLLGVAVPEELGGSGAGTVAYSLVMQELARADASVAVAVSVTNMVAELVTRAGTEAQRRMHVPRLVNGEYVCGGFALSEPQAGSDPAAMSTRARRTDKGWVLDGAKQWITSASHAGLFVVWAKVDPQAGARGIAAFLVEKDTPGLHVGRHEDKMGLRGSSTCQVVLEGCEVGKDALLGQEGDGFKIAMTALDGGRIGIASQATGVAQAALAASVTYAKERVQFGAPIARLQAIQLMLAEMATQVDAARLLALRAAWRKDAGLPFTREAATAKLWATEKAGRVCDAAIQIHGGYGYTREFPVERFLRDVRVSRIYEGTSEVQRIVIARELLRAQGAA
jgi:alkylation response protein AidB-like acyl-CoA dehydrogenase